MIDPVIFSIGNFSLRWYGVIVMIGVIVGGMIIEREVRRRGENGERIWDALIWVVPAGIIGARIWYVINATLGGNNYYMQNPVQIINIPQGGLHIFGGFLLGGLALLIYLRLNNLDTWLFLDAAGPGILVGQAIGRMANFINQELYGPPTKLLWGIKIAAEHRLALYSDLNLFPVETTRFHPTFAYEMLWNLTAAGLLLWISRRYEKELKPGALFACWLILAGVGRTWIEFFRPDQPKIDGLGISYSAVVASLMAITGVLLLLVRYRVFDLAFSENWEEEYHISEQAKPQVKSVDDEEEEFLPVKKSSTAKPKPITEKKSAQKTPARKATSTTAKKTSSKTTTAKAKKSA
jgi:phosphatidylglycerol:prolipoprotein diacylglycerol transferase